MKTQITLDKAKGKALTDVVDSYTTGGTLLIFGEFYVCLRVNTSYEPGEGSIEEGNLELFDFGDEALIASNVLSRDELENFREQRNKNISEEIEIKERAQFELLKKKFGS